MQVVAEAMAMGREKDASKGMARKTVIDEIRVKRYELEMSAEVCEWR